MNVFFYIAAAVAMVSTSLAITRRNALHALLYLIVSFLAVAVIFFLLGAPFVAALEVIVYAGAIMVLFVFVIMMFNWEASSKHVAKWASLKTWAGPLALSLVLLTEFVWVLVQHGGLRVEASMILPQEVGISLFREYLLGVELAAMLLLAGIVGAYHLGSQKRKPVHRYFEKGAAE
jgi:NADH-quinone oxidoreductase subunit J